MDVPPFDDPTRPAQAPSAWRTVVERLPGAVEGPVSLPLGNKADPYDELVYILLTVMTRSQPRLDRAFDGLVELRRDRGWSGLLEVDEERIRQVLTPLGFVNRRTEHLLGIVRRIEDEHDGSLEWLRDVPDEEALAYLTSLPGIGTKSAKCVLMYSLDRDVLPVDIHVLRVAKRLGLVRAEATWEETDRTLEETVPDGLKYDVHVQFVIHGREICRSRDPQCESCVLLDICPSGPDAPRLRADYV